MTNIKISNLPPGTANPSAVVPTDNANGTLTEKITLGAIRDLPHFHTSADISNFAVAVSGLLTELDGGSP